MRSFLHAKTLSLSTAGLLCFVALASTANAWTIDTGPGPNYGGGLSLGDDRPALPYFNQIAGQIEFSEPTSISAVQGWMNWNYPGSIIFSLLDNTVDNLPGGTLFSTTAATVPTDLNQPAWRGVSGLDWAVSAGKYWLVFADSQADPGFGSMPGGPLNAPLSRYAVANHISNGYFEPLAEYPVGMRVSAVPEVGSGSLLALGLAALILWSIPRRQFLCLKCKTL